MKTFLVIDVGREEIEIEVVDPFSLLLVDFLPLEVVFLHLIQVWVKSNVVSLIQTRFSTEGLLKWLL